MGHKELFEEVALEGHIKVQARLQMDSSGNMIKDSQLHAIGGFDFLKKVQTLRTQLHGQLMDVPLPTGNLLEDMVLRELVLKLRGEWKPPFTEEQLCHCRAVSTSKVEQAIMYGAHDAATVSLMTSASTSCGSCKDDVVSLIHYRCQENA